MESYRRCTKCKVEFPKTLEFFYKKLNGLTTRCKACTKDSNKKNYRKHRDKYLSQKRDYWVRNKSLIEIYREENKDRDNKTRRKRLAEKRKDPIFNLKKRVAGGIRRAFMRAESRKSDFTKNIVGCEFTFLRSYLISTFENNYKVKYEDRFWDKLEIDHIVPISSAKTTSDVKALNHYTNLQLLYYKDNGNKYNFKDWELDLEKTEFYNHFNLDTENLLSKQKRKGMRRELR